jgi:hypothetical protein
LILKRKEEITGNPPKLEMHSSSQKSKNHLALIRKFNGNDFKLELNVKFKKENPRVLIRLMLGEISMKLKL